MLFGVKAMYAICKDEKNGIDDLRLQDTFIARRNASKEVEDNVFHEDELRRKSECHSKEGQHTHAGDG